MLKILYVPNYLFCVIKDLFLNKKIQPNFLFFFVLTYKRGSSLTTCLKKILHNNLYEMSRTATEFCHVIRQSLVWMREGGNIDGTVNWDSVYICRKFNNNKISKKQQHKNQAKSMFGQYQLGILYNIQYYGTWIMNAQGIVSLRFSSFLKSQCT